MCRSTCVENLEKAFRDPSVCVYVMWYAMPTYVGFKQILCVRSSTVGFGRTAMSARRARRVIQSSALDSSIAGSYNKKESHKRRAMLTNEQVPLDQRVRPVVG